ncbi:Fe-S protein assembly chaperone HscA [Motiliproteus sp. MSK22-1]|uniref:Fe-S protein assembly chaperone HscA n=1 Tax=Motiliproteus sp. MSK22-1 TaxID=1897630 RepID=UPI001E3DF486|nr:Fe-S protein assembly chaperone HscA [Motiliproteus sp. MSK22-1]
MLLQIAEPGQSAKPHQHKLAVGIDLGTTNSLVASVRSGDAQTLPDEQGRHLLPSAVRYGKEGVLAVGDEAKAKASEDPLNTVLSVKRLMGRGVEDVHQLGNQLPYEFSAGDGGMPFIRTVAGDKSPVEISADILRVLTERGSKSLGGDLVGAVITVPAYFDESQRQATKDAARLAGINVLRLLNEPTAAAVAYGLDKEAEGIFAVYDLGGGTFDISILRLNRGVFEVLSTGGDSALGGDDFDHAVAEWIIEQLGDRELSRGQLRSILDVACNAKERLSDSSTASISLQHGDLSWEGTLTLDAFNQLAEPLVKKTLRACKRALKDASVKASSVREVVMVGGSTRVQCVRSLVGEYFGRRPHVEIDPDRVVAIGAAIQADVLAGNKPDSDMLLLDVIPLSLGLETMGGLVEKVIDRNTAIPVARGQEFTTYKDGQTGMVIHVLQGERELVESCRSLARFELHGIPPMAAGAAKVRVTFQVDADGLLNVSARELNSGVESAIEVKPSYGLSDSEITRMIKDSFSNAQYDHDSRTLREQQVEADRLVEALESALAADGERLLTVEDREVLSQGIAHLKRLREGDDHKAIAKGIEVLSAASDEFAARRMDDGVRRALSGHSVDEV